MLSRLGLEAEGVAEGEAALAAAATAKAAGWDYDFIFLDISMPGLDGYEVCRRLRALGTTARLYAFSGRDFGPESAQVGFDAFLQKPLTYDELKAAIGF